MGYGFVAWNEKKTATLREEGSEGTDTGLPSTCMSPVSDTTTHSCPPSEQQKGTLAHVSATPIHTLAQHFIHHWRYRYTMKSLHSQRLRKITRTLQGLTGTLQGHGRVPITESFHYVTGQSVTSQVSSRLPFIGKVGLDDYSRSLSIWAIRWFYDQCSAILLGKW